MSAAEIIEELRKLPLAEQEEVLAFLQLAQQQAKVEEPEVHYATDAEAEVAAEKVLREHSDLFRRLAQ